MNQETAALLARLVTFLLPKGDAAARSLQAVRISEEGEMRTSEESRWMSFTADLTIQTRLSEFRWEARTSGVVITDAYEDSHGIGRSRLAGLLTLKKASRGPALDRGEVQRYLSSLMLCPAAIVNHASLEWTAIGESVLRVRARQTLLGPLSILRSERMASRPRVTLSGRVSWEGTQWIPSG